jgi:predicted aspartyl protease
LPHFTLQVDSAGPLVKVAVYVSEARRAAMVAENLAVPEGRILTALVDTGASITSIEPAVLQFLGLTPTGTIDLVTPSTGDGVHTASTYDVELCIRGAAATDPPLILNNLRVAAAELFTRQGFHVLIGRDVLSQCVLIYNGSLAQFTLSF